MRVLLISDYGLQHTYGGAQRSNQLVVDSGRTRGHDVTMFHFDSDTSCFYDRYDLVISSNLEHISQISNIVEYLDSIPNHVRLEHDMNKYLTIENRRKLWRGCKASFFLTNFHYQCFLKHYGDIFPNVHIVPDPITKDFYDMGQDRYQAILYCGFFHELKGGYEFLRYVRANPDEQFVVAGWGYPDLSSFPNIKYIGKVEYEDMPHLYNSYAAFYHKPLDYEPFCRAAGEAMICGATLVANDIIGAKHMFDEDPSGFAESCYGAADKFWEILEGLQ